MSSAKKAQQIFEAAFDPTRPRDPRSEEYKAGVLAALENLENTDDIHFRHRRSPYRPGTAGSDAWHAGYSEGRMLWRLNNESTKEVANGTN